MTTPPASGPQDPNRSLAVKYGAVCAALLVVLVGLAIYGFLIKKAPEVQLTPDSGGGTTQSPPGNWGGPSSAPPARPNGWAVVIG